MNSEQLEKLEKAARQIAAIEAKVVAIRESLPDCPTCGGTSKVAHCWECEARDMRDDPCPTCIAIPGKVSPAQLIALWNAVWDDRERRDGGLGTRDGSAFIFDAADLRSVKP